MTKKIGFFTAYGRMWARTFNYKDTADKREYWFPFAFNAFIIIIAFVLMFLDMNYYVDNLGGYVTVLLIFFSVSQIPFIALTVRRLHDTGKAGWWSFLLLAVGIGTAVIMYMCSMDSYFDSLINTEPDLYGPPPIEVFYKDFVDDEENTDIDKDPIFNPEDNIPDCIYGPPEMFEKDSDIAVEDDIESLEDNDYNPSDNVSEPVYGSPAPDSATK